MPITARRTTPPLFTLRAHRYDCKRTGIGRACGVNANTSVSMVRSRLNSTAINTVMRSSKLIKPGLSMKLKFKRLSAIPMATLAMIARGNDTMPPITAATRASDSVCDPNVVTSPAEPVWPAMRTMESVESPAASAHTMVEMTFGLMPERRGQRRVAGARLDGLAERGPVQEPRQRQQGDRDDDQDREVGTPICTPATVHVPLMALG